MDLLQPFANTQPKTELLERFKDARKHLGIRWKSRMAKRFPFYDTRKGVLVMNAATDALRDERLISFNRLNALVIAMEVLVSETQPNQS